MLTTRSRRFLFFALVLIVCTVIAEQRADAHSGIQSYVYVSITDDAIEGRVEYPAADLADVLRLDLPQSSDALSAAVSANADTIRSYTDQHLAMGDEGGDWDLSYDDDPSILPVAGNYITVPFTVERSFDGAPRSFQVEFDAIIHGNPERDALFLVENDWGTAEFDNEDGHLFGFSTGATVQTVRLEDVSVLTSMTAVRGLGTDEVRVGIDHLLFVVALLLPAGLVAAGASIRDPSPTVAEAGRRAVRLLAVFVASHSAVLWVMGLGAIELSGQLVGSLVAASLLAMAVFAAWRFTSRELLVVGVLGILQGLGLGHAFVERGLDGYDVPALVAFNLGIEVGVIVIAALVFPLLLILRRTVLAAVALYGGALVIGAYASAWLIERVGDTDLDVERYANPFRVWPRNLWLMLVVWAAAGALYSWSTQRGHLRPLAGETGATDVSTDHREVLSS